MWDLIKRSKEEKIWGGQHDFLKRCRRIAETKSNPIQLLSTKHSWHCGMLYLYLRTWKTNANKKFYIYLDGTHTHTRSHAHTHVWNAMEAHFFLNICFRASLLLCSFCFFLLLCLLCFLFSASLLLCFSAFPCFFFLGGGFSSLNYIYMYNPKKHVVNKPEANPKSTPKSQLGRTYILSLLFHTVNVYCDYLYIYI